MKRIIDSWKTIRHNRGIWNSIKVIYFRDDLKRGTLVGEDEYGNKYYENNNYFVPRNRWVNYADRVRLEYDGSQVPAEWHGWLHHRHEQPPHEQAHRPRYPWLARHTENETGTRHQYVPYSTTPPKIAIWKPPKPRCSDPCSRPPPPSIGSGSSCPSLFDNSDPSECGEPAARSGSICGKPAKLSDDVCGKPVPRSGGEFGDIPKMGTSKGGCDRSSDKPKTACDKPTNAFH